MPLAARKPDPLSAYADGVVAKSAGRSWPMPLRSTKISVDVRGGVAIVETERSFSNTEDRAIEATMTFPVPGDAVLTGLRANIDGREIVASARPRKQARETYEQAIDEGRTAVLHEELIRGVHMLSLGNLPPGKSADVVVTYAVPLTFAGPRPSLRIPTTVGEVYGRSPLPASDDIETADVVLEADVRVVSDSGTPSVEGLAGAEGRLRLDGAVAITLADWSPSTARGVSADGRAVTLSVSPLEEGDADVDLTVLVDVSGSTGDPLPGSDRPTRKWDAMRSGFRQAAATLRPNDVVRLYDFATHANARGSASGAAVAALADALHEPYDGTRIGRAVETVLAAAPGKDVMIVTDGLSHDIDVQALALRKSRVHVVLVGPDALDAQVGYLAAMTGGHCFVADGLDVAGAISKAFSACRSPSTPPRLAGDPARPSAVAVGRSGAILEAAWADAVGGEADAIGRFAAGLAIAALPESEATAMAVAHGLCTHLTSLVLVDVEGTPQQGIPATRKVPMMRSAFRASGSARMALVSHSAAPQPMFMLGSPTGGDPIWLDNGDDLTSLPDADPDILRQGKGGKDPFRQGRWPARRGMPGYGDFPPAFPDFPSLPRMPSPFPAPRATPRRDMASVAATVDWDDLAGRDLPGELGAFPRDVQLWIMQASTEAHVVALATALGKPPILVAIGLLAGAAKGYRSAQRLSRSVLSGAVEADLDMARRELAA